MGRFERPIAPGQPLSLLPWLRRFESNSNPLDSRIAVAITSSYNNVFSIPIATTGSYLLRGKLTRIRSGSHKTVGILLPAGSGKTMLALDHEKNGISGLYQIDHVGGGRSTNPTKCPVTLVDGQAYTFAAEVQLQGGDAQVTVQLDGKEIIHWHGPQKSLNIAPAWKAEDVRKMGLALGDADVSVEQLDFTPLDEGARMLAPPPDQPLPPPPGATVVASSENIDLLPLLDLEHGVIKAKAKRTGQGIELSAAAGNPGRLAVPVWPRGAYELQCDFTASTQQMVVAVVIPTNRKRVAVVPLNGRFAVGLQDIDKTGPRNGDNPTSTKPGRVIAGRRHKLLIRVVPAGSECEINIHLDTDKEPLFSWKGSEDDLSLRRWQTPHQKLIALGCSGGSMTCHALQLKMLSGEAWILAPRRRLRLTSTRSASEGRVTSSLGTSAGPW